MERGAQRRRSAHRSCTHARTPRQCQRFRRRVGGADASAEKRPGAALARDDAGPRSAAREHRRRVRRRVRESRVQALQRPRGARTARPRRCRPNSVRPQGSPQRAISEAEAMPRRRAGPARSEAERFMSAGASPMSPLGCGARHGACQREVRGGAPGTRRVERPSPSSPRAPEPPWSVPSHGARWRRACPAPGGLFVDAHDTISQSARSGGTTRTTTTRASTPGTSTKGRRLRLRAEGRWSCRSSRVAPAGAPAPRRHGPVKPRRVASLRPRAAFGPRRTAVARKPSALGLSRFSCVPRGNAARGRPLRPPGPQAARSPNKLRRPRRRRRAAKARSPRRAFAATKAWPRRPRASSGRRARRHFVRADGASDEGVARGDAPALRAHAPRHARG